MDPKTCQKIKGDLFLLFLPERGHHVGCGPSDDKRYFLTFVNFDHVFHGTSCHPYFGYAYFLLQFEVATGASFGHQKQVVEQKQVPLLALNSLQREIEKKKN